MKTFIAFVLLAIFMVPTQSARVCRLNCNLSSTTQICAKQGNFCRRFGNSCAHLRYNCFNNQSFVAVALSRCRGIAVGSRGTCATATNTSGTTSISSILSTLNNLYPNGNIVTPIVIRV